MNLGATSIDLYKKEREYETLSLSDENVVKYLLLYRSKVDILSGVSMNNNIYQSGDTTSFNQELIALYTSLDNLISKIKLKERDVLFLKLLFEGNEITDIVEVHSFPKMSAYRILDRIVKKIVEENMHDWKKTINIRLS